MKKFGLLSGDSDTDEIDDITDSEGEICCKEKNFDDEKLILDIENSISSTSSSRSSDAMPGSR